MIQGGRRPGLQRSGAAGEHRVTYVELFYDLVFVFAITQLSHTLLDDLSVTGMLHTLLLFVAVWWVWIDTSWMTNWLNPERLPVRCILLVLMLLGLVVSSSIPEAFDGRGLSFALAYAAMQVSLPAFVIWALGVESPDNTRNFQRILAWRLFAAIFWVAGGFASDGGRLALWLVALGIESASAASGFWTPKLGRSTTHDWNIDGGHMAERCGLFVIIALGESVLVTGGAFAAMEWAPVPILAFGVAFLGSVLMWWLYFDHGARSAAEQIEADDDPGRLARLAYTYVHILIVGGIVVSAAGDELLLEHPLGHTEPVVAALITGGLILFLLGNLLFKRTTTGLFAGPRAAGIVLLVAVGLLSGNLSPLVTSALATGVLLVVAVWETMVVRSAGRSEAGVETKAGFETPARGREAG